MWGGHEETFKACLDELLQIKIIILNLLSMLRFTKSVLGYDSKIDIKAHINILNYVFRISACIWNLNWKTV